TDEVHVERQVRAVLLDGAAGHDTDLAQLDGVVDLGPGQLLVTVLPAGTAGHDVSWCGRAVGPGRAPGQCPQYAAPAGGNKEKEGFVSLAQSGRTAADAPEPDP